MECINCTVELPSNGFFCPNCSTQFKCKVCSELLLKDAKVCIYCGTQMGNNEISPNMNTIEFSETKNSRTFKANFTDTVGQSISDSFSIILSNKISTKKPAVLPASKPLFINSDVETAEVAEVVGADQVDSDELSLLKKIFKSDGEKTTLSETRLKAKSKMDYGKRLSIIFLYYKYLSGVENVPRRDLSAILLHASVEDGNLRHWLANNPLIGINDDLVELKAPGKDSAREYLNQIFNPEVKDKWQIGTQSRSGRKPKEKKNNK